MYLVLARKYRPHTFDDVIGQEHVARTLKNAVRQGRVAHAYLFCGSRGVGKTSMARILAAALNCSDGPTEKPCMQCEHCRRIAVGSDLDVMEIDGASNRGIDEVRELRQNAKVSPAGSRFKIYYIDEVHMLTQQAFNALLKTLEEPPPHVKFIFSTTDPQQLPETVKSRCQRFDFRRISDAGLIKHLRMICEKEGLAPEQGALEAIARAARGGVRDALGTLDQVTAFSDSEVKLEDVLTVLGAARTRTLTELTDALARGGTGDALKLVHEVLFSGIDMLDFIDQISEYLRDLLVAKYCDSGDELLAGAAADQDTLKRQAGLFAPEQILYMIQILREARRRARRETTGKLALELAVIKLSRLDELLLISEALHGDSGRPGPAAPAKEKAPDPAESRQRDNPDGERGGQSERIKDMLRRLQNHGGKKQDDRRPTDTAEPAGDPPAGIKPEKFRMIRDVSESSGVQKQAMQNKLMLETFAGADEKFDLQPVRLYREEDTDGEQSA